MKTEGPGGSGHKVGELAAATGLTVRTLHYYDEIGLLVASGRTEGGHRLYSDTDVERLYRICLFRRLGLPLDEIGRAFDDPEWNLRFAMTTHLSELEGRLQAGGRLRSRLQHLLDSMGTADSPMTDELLGVLADMTTLEGTVQRRISILVYSDLEAANDFLTRVFRLGPGKLTRDDTGRVVHAELQAGDGVLWLHPETATYGLASPRLVGASTACMAVMVDDVDAHYRHASEQGAEIVYEPLDQPYGYREYSARDSEGGLWSFMKAID